VVLKINLVLTKGLTHSACALCYQLKKQHQSYSGEFQVSRSVSTIIFVSTIICVIPIYLVRLPEEPCLSLAQGGPHFQEAPW